ncbi:helix-turn-helix domain-containing protein [Cryobacterium gelidum]|nr:helix-turn-helix domain-containing protein [Cryobacterium gelidum]
MRDISRAPLSGRFLTFVERDEIVILRAQNAGVLQIAQVLSRSPSTIYLFVATLAAPKREGR